jgi:hypothetical protein
MTVEDRELYLYKKELRPSSSHHFVNKTMELALQKILSNEKRRLFSSPFDSDDFLLWGY